MFLYLCYTLLIIYIYHFNNLNEYGNGFLIGKIILLNVFGFIIYRTNPFGNTLSDKNQ